MIKSQPAAWKSCSYTSLLLPSIRRLWAGRFLLFSPPRSSDKACARRHHAAEGGIALVELPATLRLRAGGGRPKERLGGQRLRFRSLGRADLHGDRRRGPGHGAARSGLHQRRHRCKLGGRLADELVGHSERGRRARRRAGGHAAELGGYWWQHPHGQGWCHSRLYCPQADRQQGSKGGRGGVNSFQDTHPPPYFLQLKSSAFSVTLVNDLGEKENKLLSENTLSCESFFL